MKIQLHTGTVRENIIEIASDIARYFGWRL